MGQFCATKEPTKKYKGVPILVFTTSQTMNVEFKKTFIHHVIHIK
jgi:hypothetical protein